MMSGRNPTTEQLRYWDMLAADIGCIACHMDGVANTYVSIHHCAGRTHQNAHWLVLPLCAGHHQDGTGAPGLIAVHPYKARFEGVYGTQSELMRKCASLLLEQRLQIPGALMDALEMDVVGL